MPNLDDVLACERLSASIRQAIGEYESALDVRVQALWLSRSDAQTLRQSSDFDPEVGVRVLAVYPGLLGYYAGMRVCSSDIVPISHIAFLPEGWQGYPLNADACSRLPVVEARMGRERRSGAQAFYDWALDGTEALYGSVPDVGAVVDDAAATDEELVAIFGPNGPPAATVWDRILGE